MELTVSIGVLTAITIGLVQVVKKIGLNTKFAPLAAIAFGVVFSFLFIPDWKQALAMGTIVGLTSVGLYSGAVNTTEGVKAIAQRAKH